LGLAAALLGDTREATEGQTERYSDVQEALKEERYRYALEHEKTVPRVPRLDRQPNGGAKYGGNLQRATKRVGCRYLTEPGQRESIAREISPSASNRECDSPGANQCNFQFA
jgi:hypothetical protein